jgi:cytochrome c oxidase assembly protein subunit 11
VTKSPRTRRNGMTVALLACVVVGMAGLAFASVPLYRLFCQATGFGGTTQRAATAPREIADTVVTVRFDAETSPELPWDFHPLTASVQVHPGEQREVFYRATNRSGAATTGTATFNVTPAKTGIYFDKLQCFCFTEQRLAPGESRDMGVTFFVDPDLVKDPGTKDVRAITLSYTMFRKPDAETPAKPSAAAGPRGATAAVN